MTRSKEAAGTTWIAGPKNMQVAHLLRKYNPVEWGGTETAIKRLFDGLRFHQVNSVVYCPKLDVPVESDPLSDSGYCVKRFKACVPVWGISEDQKRQLISVGGNLLSFDVMGSLLRQSNLSLIHTHTANRLGGIALTVARLRRIPLVVTVHGGYLDLPQAAHDYLLKPLEGGFEWGKLFGLPLRSRKVLEQADAIITCNRKEAALLGKKYPYQRIVVQPHGVPTGVYQPDRRAAAREAFPQICGKQVLLIVGRIDPIKNQGWVVEEAPDIFRKYPNALLVLAGACTDAAYGVSLQQRIKALGLENKILRTGGIPPNDPRLIGLFQEAEVVLLPSVSETFGLVILEAWATGTTVIASRTSGASEMISEGENGWLFDLDRPSTFHQALEQALLKPELTMQFAAAGQSLVGAKYDTNVLGGQVKKLYQQLVEEHK